MKNCNFPSFFLRKRGTIVRLRLILELGFLILVNFMCQLSMTYPRRAKEEGHSVWKFPKKKSYFIFHYFFIFLGSRLYVSLFQQLIRHNYTLLMSQYVDKFYYLFPCWTSKLIVFHPMDHTFVFRRWVTPFYSWV